MAKREEQNALKTALDWQQFMNNWTLEPITQPKTHSKLTKQANTKNDEVKSTSQVINKNEDSPATTAVQNRSELIPRRAATNSIQVESSPPKNDTPRSNYEPVWKTTRGYSKWFMGGQRYDPRDPWVVPCLAKYKTRDLRTNCSIHRVFLSLYLSLRPLLLEIAI